MSIYIDKKTKVIVQGITGAHGMKHTRLMLDFGTQVVAGVTPGKLGTSIHGLPVFDTVKQAVDATDAKASVIFVPPAFAADAILEAVDANLDLCVCITENIPVQDMLKVKHYMRGKPTRLIGPNGPGLVTAGAAKIGIMPSDIHLPGHVGVVSRSGSLTYETIKQLTRAGIGQSTAVGIGGDPIKGTSFLDVVRAFDADADTYAIILIGEIGGDGEQQAAYWLKEHSQKPAVAFISGQTAPPGKRMGHAGAIISGGRGTASEKMKILDSCGIPVASTSDTIGATLIEQLRKFGIYEKCLVN
ncbi:succinate--CoA ligase [ADP-forming] subunit alpha [Deltaproteobacteria bacterium]|nr:succinate--CoA ligase [ADP-forming] subunit alpha [Deltaproteobacteria bacterium]